jgi:hypothetical protein
MSSERPKAEKPEGDIPSIEVDGALTMHREDGATVTLFHKTKPVATSEISSGALDRLIRGLKGPPGPRH